MLNDLKLIEVTPSSCHLVGATGPLEGARRLWGPEKRPSELQRIADVLAVSLDVSPEVMEDTLCNWQKS